MQSTHPYRDQDIELPLPRRFSIVSALGVGLVGVGIHALFVTACWPNITSRLGLVPYVGYGRHDLVFYLLAMIAFGAFVSLSTALGWSLAREDRRPRGLELAVAALPASLAGCVLSAIAYVVTYPPSPSSFAMGRRLRAGRKLLAPDTTSGDAWRGDERFACIDAPAEVAEEWRRAARHEHAAITAFTHVALELVAVGAPPDLVADAQRAALDEIRHTRTCFDIARAIDGRDASPAPFPEARTALPAPVSRSRALVRLAVDAVVDGALNEAVAGRVLARLASRCEDGSLGTRLRAMAADESRHAAHSWRVVAWCLEEGGEDVGSALRDTLRSLPARLTGDTPEAARDGSWERWGVQGETLERAEWDKARRHAILRLGSLLAT
jgi:hypothetical protein